MDINNYFWFACYMLGLLTGLYEMGRGMGAIA